MSRRKRTHLEAIHDRLMHSRNRDERRAIYVGRSHDHGYPILLDTDLLFEHMHIIGPTGTGKTSIGVETLLLQLIRRGDGPVVIFDCKGDASLFNLTMKTAKSTGQTFKWFTNKPYYSTYAFNPWDQKLLRRLTLQDIVGLNIQSLNLNHGDDYARAWFGINARILLKRAIEETLPKRENGLHRRGSKRKFPKHGVIQSFRDLYKILEELTNDNDEFKAAQHLAFIVESLAEFKQLNLAPNRDPNHPALAHAIHMPEVIREKQIIYFYLVGAMDMASVAQLARLALHSLLVAAIAHKDKYGETPRIYSIWDEAQVMIAKNIESVLTQARSHGLACILAHQAISQLNPAGGSDLRELVLNCTAVKQVFGARDPWSQQYISSTSGITKYCSQSYNVTPQDAQAGAVGLDYVCPDRDDTQRVNIHEYTGPRQNSQDILNASQDPNVSLMWFARNAGLTRYKGWFPVHTSWPISYDQHKELLAAPWPSSSGETIEMPSDWPAENGETLTPTTHPPLAMSEEEISASKKLQDLAKLLQHKPNNK